MNKKILVVSISVAFMLATISFASAVEPSPITNVEKKESPLYKIRIEQVINEKFFSSRTLVLIFTAVLLGFSIAAIIGSVSDKVNADPGPPVYTEIVLPTSCIPQCE